MGTAKLSRCDDNYEEGVRGVAGTPLSRVFAAIESAGAYRAFPAGDHAASAARDRERRRMFFRLGVAGLCMMQVMMYAWPSYLGSDSGLTPDIARLLEWASLMMSLPVVLFSAWPFYANAWGDLRRGRVGMDLPVALGAGTRIGVRCDLFDQMAGVALRQGALRWLVSDGQ